MLKVTRAAISSSVAVVAMLGCSKTAPSTTPSTTSAAVVAVAAVASDTLPTHSASSAISTTIASPVSVSDPSPEQPVSASKRLVAAARSQVGVTVGYDPSYVGLEYPGGDVAASTGVCTDVLVRALREQGIDLQERIHIDMAANFSKYPATWGLTGPDSNIDHRRVPNIANYFARRGYELPVTQNPDDYQPGDIVWIKLPLDHTGIVSDRKKNGRPLLIHNIGNGTQEEDVLFSWKIVGHFRVVP